MAKAPKSKCKDPRKSAGYLINLEDGVAHPIEDCATEKGKTYCVGDRVERLGVKKLKPAQRTGTVVGTQKTRDKKQSVLVCWDSNTKDDSAYPYLWSEIKKL